MVGFGLVLYCLCARLKPETAGKHIAGMIPPGKPWLKWHSCVERAGNERNSRATGV